MVMVAERNITDFVPDGANDRTLRDAFGRFATGVTIVTATTEDGPVGITANSFSSLSMHPPLVLWSPDKNSRRYEYFAQADRFAIHVLAADQEALCWRVAKDGFALAENEWSQSPNGCPVLTDSLARFECAHHASFDCGDHTIIVGRVLRAAFETGRDALGFFGGKAGRFAAPTE